MALPLGLLPVFVLALTVGVATVVTLGAHLLWRGWDRPFQFALQRAFFAAGVFYLGVTVVVWVVAGGSSMWEVAATILVAGVAAAGVLWTLPLLVGQRLVARFQQLDSETALRFATYGWPIAMLVVATLFVAPGGLTDGHLFSLGGPQMCLVGFCGVSRAVVAVVVLQVVVALVGPGLVGAGLYATRWDALSLDGR
ncbi:MULTISPECIES: hypothetical protein [Haloferax]|uniref:Uncharacterized protein n=1 Tax=Haloferax massiliensis TaxID=1476858 RepID=A0A0D6JTS4_9EURY|nr:MULTISPECIES: hypothetical protein [Haloferax]MDS0242051.1 hypothetical protein [Haloferax sp. S2CR25]MDS0445172.1 hypothetical protein [Haloferax sp. S2CR25-2]CQR50980.1 hypothetical protein BN996_02466 [Haloferax massiliensis]